MNFGTQSSPNTKYFITQTPWDTSSRSTGLGANTWGLEGPFSTENDAVLKLATTPGSSERYVIQVTRVAKLTQTTERFK